MSKAKADQSSGTPDSAETETSIKHTEFARSVLEGLSSNPKSLSSKYLYDSRGDKLFQQIMGLPEYYLSRCEEDILVHNKEKILQAMQENGQPFKLIELGPGDGKKTKVLLRHFLGNRAEFDYVPVDISRHALKDLCSTLEMEFPGLRVRAFAKDYFTALRDIGKSGNEPKMVLFMGGNIGNFSKEDASNFLLLLSERLNSGDMLLAGFDLKKDPEVIYRAYNDSQGVTRSFNFNLLQRINRELGGNFDPVNFTHYPTYDPLTGAMKSYLLSKKAHVVNIAALDAEVEFDDWEPIFMEVSNKYSVGEIRNMAKSSGLSISHLFYDSRRYYVNVLLKKN